MFKSALIVASVAATAVPVTAGPGPGPNFPTKAVADTAAGFAYGFFLINDLSEFETCYRYCGE